MRSIFKSLTFCTAALALTAGYSQAADSTAAGKAAPQETKAAVPPAQSLSGKVVETIPVGTYSYICVEKDGKKTWAAIPKKKVVVGQQVEVRPGMEIVNFLSKTLNRRFETIIFSDGLASDPSAGAHMTPGKSMPAGHPALSGGEAVAKSSTPSLISAEGKVVEVLKTDDYNFVSVEKDGMKTWVRVDTQTSVKPGDAVRFVPGTEKLNFQSGDLGRTFDRVILSSGLDTAK